MQFPTEEVRRCGVEEDHVDVQVEQVRDREDTASCVKPGLSVAQVGRFGMSCLRASFTPCVVASFTGDGPEVSGDVCRGSDPVAGRLFGRGPEAQTSWTGEDPFFGSWGFLRHRADPPTGSPPIQAKSRISGFNASKGPSTPCSVDR